MKSLHEIVVQCHGEWPKEYSAEIAAFDDVNELMEWPYESFNPMDCYYSKADFNEEVLRLQDNVYKTITG